MTLPSTEASAKAALEDIFNAAKTGGAVLRAAIMQHGGPSVGMYDTAVSNTISAAVNWRHGPNMHNRDFFTDLERSLIAAIDKMLDTGEK